MKADRSGGHPSYMAITITPGNDPVRSVSPTTVCH